MQNVTHLTLLVDSDKRSTLATPIRSSRPVLADTVVDRWDAGGACEVPVVLGVLPASVRDQGSRREYTHEVDDEARASWQ
jgi:hypothetical protein